MSCAICRDVRCVTGRGLDPGLDRGLDPGLDPGLDRGLDRGRTGVGPG
ncbi:MAG: hypothetical protein JWN79_951 [Gemmatimonadetes bacterium]|nr:hypothetical protein [Gemmatimonadota bacterium]